MIGEKGRDVTMVDFLRRRSFFQQFFSWKKTFTMWIELKNLWTTIIPNTPGWCAIARGWTWIIPNTPGSYAIAWGTSAVTKPLSISFDPCIWAKMFATLFQLNLIVFTKTIHHRRRPPPPPHHHHQTLLSQSLLNLSPMRPKLLEELGRYSARDFPKLPRKEFLATNLHFAHQNFTESLQIFLLPFGKGDH